MLIGIDASTKKTGYAILDKKDNIIGYGLIKSDRKDFFQRIEEIFFKLRAIIKQYNISQIVIEDVPVNYRNNLKTAKELSVLQGLILSLSFDFNIPIKLYNPSSHRSINGLYDGTRKGMKREVQKQLAVEKANKLYNLDLNYYIRDTKSKISDDDIAEAIMIARAFFIELENKEENKNESKL